MNPVLADTKFEGRLPVGEIVDDLVNEGLLEADDARLTKAVAKGAEHRDKHALMFIAERSIAGNSEQTLTVDFLTQWYADKSGLPYHRIDPLKVDVPSVTAVVSYAYAARFHILPIDVTEKAVTFAVAEPYVREWEQELETILRKEIVRVFASPDQIQRYLTEFYSLSRSVRSASEDDANAAPSGVQNLEQLVELGRAGRLDANDQHVVNIVDWLLQYAFDQRASDIHLEPRREHGSVRFRIDGVLHNVYEIPAAVMAAVTSRIKIVGRMDVAEKRRPQDGRLKTRDQEGREVELRLSTMPTAFGEKLVMRIFNPDVLVKTATQLGFSRAENDVWQELIDNPHGIVLVTGPTGSGKTTTLYSTLKQIAVPEINVSTIEDPIELVMSEFNQMQVQPNIGLDFASGVRTLLRQDPDVVMVGEIRDLETAEMATQAALTGHLVLSTLHTNDAPSAITRLLELGVPSYLINATLLGVVAQRLSRTLCPHCREPTALDANVWRDLVRPWSSKAPAQINKADGCLECRNTGYMGRTGIYEIFKVSPLIRGLISESSDIADIRRAAVQEGMKPLRLSGAQKVAAGQTSVEEVFRVTPPPSGA
ncbi:MAG: GspE/PulE family protein [Gammaproteobacteria bacterium]|nr:GspE/PulE family protein [Gammaproteobacteria bacterium]